jgi:hypothetical protein
LKRRARAHVRELARDREERKARRAAAAQRGLVAVESELAAEAQAREAAEVARLAAVEAQRRRRAAEMEQRAARIRAMVSEAEHGAKKQAAAAAAAAATKHSSRGVSPPPPALRSHVGLCVESSSRAAHRAEAQHADGLDTTAAVHSSHSGGKHVSAFRRTVLEERRAQKEAAAVARHELEGQLARAADYAEKVRAAARASAERARAHKLRGPVDDPWAYKTAATSSSAVPRPPPLSSASARSAQQSPQQQQRAVLQRKYAEEGDAPHGGSSSGSVVLPHVGFGHRPVCPRLAGAELEERQAAVRAAAVEAQRHRAARRRHREHELEIAERAAAAAAAADDAAGASGGSFSAVSKGAQRVSEASTYEARLAMIEARVNGSSTTALEQVGREERGG